MQVYRLGRANTTGGADRGEITPSGAVKSEYLREALRERKSQMQRPTTPEGPKAKTPAQPPLLADEWIQDAEEERLRSCKSARRPQYSRRSSAFASYGESPFSVPEPMTTKDQQTRMNQLQNENFNLKLKVDSLERRADKMLEDHGKVVDELEELRRVRDEKERLEERCSELKKKNDQLAEANARGEVAYNALQHDTDKLEGEKSDLWALNDEISKELVKRQNALDEAVEMIYKLEEEKAALSRQVRECKASVNAIDAPAPSRWNGDSDYYSTEAENDSPQRMRTPQLAPGRAAHLSSSTSDYHSDVSSPTKAPSIADYPVSEKAQALKRDSSRGRERATLLRERASLLSLVGLVPADDAPEAAPVRASAAAAAGAASTDEKNARERAFNPVSLHSSFSSVPTSPVRRDFVRPSKPSRSLRGLYAGDDAPPRRPTTSSSLSPSAEVPEQMSASLGALPAARPKTTHPHSPTPPPPPQSIGSSAVANASQTTAATTMEEAAADETADARHHLFVTRPEYRPLASLELAPSPLPQRRSRRPRASLPSWRTPGLGDGMVQRDLFFNGLSDRIE